METSQLDRIERKLDRIIRFFHIDQEPQRTRQELERMADQAVQETLDRRGLKVVQNKIIVRKSVGC